MCRDCDLVPAGRLPLQPSPGSRDHAKSAPHGTSPGPPSCLRSYAALPASVAGLIWDSAPAFLRPRVTLKVLAEVEPPSLARSLRSAYYNAVERVQALTGTSRGASFWAAMQRLAWAPQLFLYSEDDHLCDATKARDGLLLAGARVVEGMGVRQAGAGVHPPCPPACYSSRVHPSLPPACLSLLLPTGQRAGGRQAAARPGRARALLAALGARVPPAPPPPGVHPAAAGVPGRGGWQRRQWRCRQRRQRQRRQGSAAAGAACTTLVMA